MLDPAKKDDLIALIKGNYDAAFLCLHGEGDEDGSIQGFLELVGIPYTGSGIWSSATAMDKLKTKRVYALNNIPTAPSVELNYGDVLDYQQVVDALGSSDVVVKSSTGGSSIGVVIVKSGAEYDEALKKVSAYGSSILIERFVQGREVTVAVLDAVSGARKPLALPVVEIVSANDTYDFEAKYAPNGSEHICPARLEESVTKKLQQFAIAAHVALECRGASRTDFIVYRDEPIALETNTIPGMTATSLLPDAAHAVGIGFEELCMAILQSAL